LIAFANNTAGNFRILFLNRPSQVRSRVASGASRVFELGVSSNDLTDTGCTERCLVRSGPGATFDERSTNCHGWNAPDANAPGPLSDLGIVHVQHADFT